MDLQISTPALLFPALSLLMLAYTNRFLSLAHLARDLKASYLLDKKPNLWAQLNNLQRRIRLIRSTQASGVLSFTLCVASMIFIQLGLSIWAFWTFAGSLGLMLLSLGLSLWEIIISVQALKIELSECPPPSPEPDRG